MNCLFLAEYAINRLWKDSTWRTRGQVVKLCVHMRGTYFSTNEFGPGGERGSLVGLKDQLKDGSSRLRGLMRSHDPTIDVKVGGMGTSPQFHEEAS